MSEIEQKIFIAIVSILATLVLREWFARRREERDRSAWQTNNIKPFYFDQYLTDEIKEQRKSLQKIEKEYFISLDKSFDENKDKISKALQRIGIMMYIGAIPLSYVLIMNGYQVVTDWMRISKFVDDIRGGNWLAAKSNNIPYCRRHAEWLALVCFMYLKTSRYSINGDMLKDFECFEKHYGGYKKVLKSEGLLRKCDLQFAGKANLSAVKLIRLKYRVYSMLRKI